MVVTLTRVKWLSGVSEKAVGFWVYSLKVEVIMLIGRNSVKCEKEGIRG